jgi:hypothetical protein
MRVLVAAILLASVAFAITVFVVVPPHAEAGPETAKIVDDPTPCPAPAATWCHEVGGLAE